MLRFKILWALSLGVFLVSSGEVLALSSVDLKNDDKIYSEPATVKLGRGIVFSDAVFGSKVSKITDAEKDLLNGQMPDYAKRQAWNIDESLIMLRDADSNVYIYDAKTFQLLKEIDGVVGEDVFWSPTNAKEIWFHIDEKFESTNVDSGEHKVIFDFKGYDFANTKGEGNVSRDGKYYAVAGQVYNQQKGETIFKDLMVLNIPEEKIVSKMALPASLDGFDWVSISPLGNYVVVDYANQEAKRFHGVEVYDRDFKLIWQKPLGAGHSDLGVDEKGKEFLLMDYYDEDLNQTLIKKFDLESGAEAIVLSLSPLFDLHESCRNDLLVGWCLISTFDYVQKLTATADDWLPFENEIFLVKLDGSKEVKRIAHHYSRRYSPENPDSDHSNYFAEPHATINRKGDKVLFASNWEQNLGDTKGVDTYLAEWDNLSVSHEKKQIVGGIFADVDESDSGYDAIKYLKDNGIVSGYADGSFKPDQKINRAEFVKIVVGMLRKQSGQSISGDKSLKGLDFNDIEEGGWYIPYLRKAFFLALIQGYPDGSFGGNKQISYAEAAKILIVAKKIPIVEGLNWYQAYVDKVDEMKAKPVSVMAIDQEIDRRQMAEMIYNLNKK